LAGPVVADDRRRLVRPEREVGLAQCDDTPEMLLNVPRLEQRWRRGRRRHQRDDIVVMNGVTIPDSGARVKGLANLKGVKTPIPGRTGAAPGVRPPAALTFLSNRSAT